MPGSRGGGVAAGATERLDGAEGLLGAGDFLALLGGETIRFQAATARPEELLRTAALLQQVAEAKAGVGGDRAERVRSLPKGTRAVPGRSGAQGNDQRRRLKPRYSRTPPTRLLLFAAPFIICGRSALLPGSIGAMSIEGASMTTDVSGTS